MKHHPLFVRYERKPDGLVIRTHTTVRPPEFDIADYSFPESLHGWPERIVYWPVDTGPCFGIAPMLPNNH